MEPRLADAIGDYLRAYIERHGRKRTAEAFGVSRHTLWRFLERSQAGRALPQAVLDRVGESQDAVNAATQALLARPAPAPEENPPPDYLPVRLEETLLDLCATPLATVSELASFTREPVSSLRDRLSQLRRRGLADWRPHRLAALGERPQRRWFPTAEGVEAASEAGGGGEGLLRTAPVSRQWFRLLAERLDSVAISYRVTERIAEADPEGGPVRVDHYRSGPYDALVTLSDGRTLGLLRQGPMLTPANLRYRLRSIERLHHKQRPQLSLVLAASDQDARRALRALGHPMDHRSMFVAATGEVLAGDVGAHAWQQCGNGLDSATPLAPELRLPDILGWLSDRIDAERKHGRTTDVRPDRRSLYSARMRATRPSPAEQLDDASAVRLSRTDKRVLDLLADWPLCTAEQLAGLMGGVGRRRVNQALRRLRRRRLVQRDGAGGGYVLSDDGLTVLARRDRAAVGPVLDRWTPQQHESVYIGTSLRSLASQRDHQRGIVGFASRLSAEVGALPEEYELFDLLPTHRSQISYDAAGARQLLLPDVSFLIAHLGYFEWCLFEYERRATTPRRLPTRLRSYERYFRSRYAANDHGGLPPLVLFLFESERAEEGFLHVASFLPDVLLASTTTAVLEERGVLEQAWCLPPPHAPRRRFLADLRLVAKCPDDS
ncbi:MAG: replication-relaxation family protein [Chloroflexi bacterium]|nr:replication-relaxation family protein [Chloroflexota bacterium]